MRPFWRRGYSKPTAYTSIWQRTYDRIAGLLVFKQSPGMPRYYDNDGNTIATVTVGTVSAVALDACIQEDNSTSTFTDFTDELADAAANDVDFFPAGAGVDDAVYFGANDFPAQLSINTGTGGAGTYTVTWQYSKGSGVWDDLTTVSDGTTNFKTTGAQAVTYDRPNDADRDIITTGGTVDHGPYFWIRAVRDAGTVTTDPLGTQGTATPSTMPHQYSEPSFYGARYTGQVAIHWVADSPTDTVSFEVWARTDSVVTQEGDDNLFEGHYVLVHTETNLADHAEVIVDTGHRPVYVRPTTTDAGILRIGPA